MEGSTIHQRSQAELKTLDTMAEVAFMSRAEDALRAAYAQDEAAFVVSAKAFMEAERPVVAQLETGVGGLAQHAYAGFRELFEHRAQANCTSPRKVRIRRIDESIRKESQDYFMSTSHDL